MKHSNKKVNIIECNIKTCGSDVSLFPLENLGLASSGIHHFLHPRGFCKTAAPPKHGPITGADQSSW